MPIERGEIIRDWPEGNGSYKRFAFTQSGISPRALPGTANAVHVAASDDHDEEGILISDVFTCQPVRRKSQEKRMKKVERALAELPAPKLDGPEDAQVTLIGWGSTKGVIREAARILGEDRNFHQSASLQIHSPFSCQRGVRSPATVPEDNLRGVQLLRPIFPPLAG